MASVDSQDCWSFENQILPDNLESLLYAAKASRAPYQLPSGPDVLGVQISPAGVTPGGLVQIIAQVDDTRFNTLGGQEPTQKITASEMYIDIPPWSLGAVPLGMSPADGGYDQNMETSTYSLDTSGLSTGRHTVYVRGQDADGHWGVVTGAFLYILDAESASTIEGYLRDAGTGLPLAGTVTANDIFSVESNPLTGFYQIKSIGGVYDVSASVPGYGQGTANMNVQPGASIQQDFNLYPVCTIFSDNVENGDAGWEEDPSWGIVDFYTHSTGHAWAESPSGSYQNNQDSSLRSPGFDLSQYQNITLSFWQVCNTETGWDLCQVETSRDGGTNWEVIAAFSGEGTSWRKVEVPLSNLAGEPNARFRFRFTSDGSNTADGWRLDDFKLEGSGPLCMPPLSNAQAYHQKSTSQTTVDAGSVLTYTLSYQADLSGSHTYALAITDILPDALEVMTGTIYLEDNSNLAGSFHPELYQPGENILKVESAGIFTDSYQVTVTYQSRVNSAAVVDSQITGIVQTSSMVDGALVVLPPAAADPVTVTASADLVLTMTPASSFTFLGQIALFKIEILNQGPSDAQSLLITDTLPVSLTLSAAPMCEIDSQKGLVTCQAASLSAGQKIDFEVYARASVTGTVTNQAAVSTTTRDPDLSNNISASDVQVLFPAYRFWLPFVQRQPPK